MDGQRRGVAGGTQPSWGSWLLLVMVLAGLVGMHHLGGGGHGSHAGASAPAAAHVAFAEHDQQQHVAAVEVQDAVVPLATSLPPLGGDAAAACAIALLSALVTVPALTVGRHVLDRAPQIGHRVRQRRQPRARPPGSLLTQLCVLRT